MKTNLFDFKKFSFSWQIAPLLLLALAAIIYACTNNNNINATVNDGAPHISAKGKSAPKEYDYEYCTLHPGSVTCQNFIISQIKSNKDNEATLSLSSPVIEASNSEVSSLIDIDQPIDITQLDSESLN